MTQDKGTDARRGDGSVKKPRRNIRAASDLAPLEDDSPDPASLGFSLLEQGMEFHLSRVQHKGLKRPHFRTQLERLLGEEGKVVV
jgi:hypothetical protein